MLRPLLLPIALILCLLLAQSRLWQETTAIRIVLPTKVPVVEFSSIETQLSKIVVDKHNTVMLDTNTASRLHSVTEFISGMNKAQHLRFKFLLLHSFNPPLADQFLVLLGTYQAYRSQLAKLTPLETSKSPLQLRRRIEALQSKLFGEHRAAQLFDYENKIRRVMAAQQQRDVDGLLL